MLTDRLRRKLAKEARKLAMECVEGTVVLAGDGFNNGIEGTAPACAMFTLYRRFGRHVGLNNMLGNEDDLSAASVLFEANDKAADLDDRRARVVFPLLALADEIDPLPRAAPSPTPNTRKER